MNFFRLSHCKVIDRQKNRGISCQMGNERYQEPAVHSVYLPPEPCRSSQSAKHRDKPDYPDVAADNQQMILVVCVSGNRAAETIARVLTRKRLQQRTVLARIEVDMSGHLGFTLLARRADDR